MSEETRRIRAEAQAAADIEISTIQETIAILEETIEKIQRGVPLELPEDHEWRLAQLDPISRHLVELSEKMFREAALHEIEQQCHFLTNMKFVEGTQHKVGTQLRIRLPNDYVVSDTIKLHISDPKKDQT